MVEIDYENPLTANTRTQERRWDSAKSASHAAPLSAANAAITSYSYSCPGLVDTVTDPNGYQTKTGYDGNCLFPQWQTAANGWPEARTTGLIAQSTDNDNGVTPNFTYHRLGRRTLTVEAANSQEERRTVMEYDDGNRRVVTRADRCRSRTSIRGGSR